MVFSSRGAKISFQPSLCWRVIGTGATDESCQAFLMGHLYHSFSHLNSLLIPLNSHPTIYSGVCFDSLQGEPKSDKISFILGKVNNHRPRPKPPNAPF